jgi:hypothetical protein
MDGDDELEHSMELVTLAHATLNRIGSASTPGVVRHNEVHLVREFPDGSPQTLRELVTTIAEEHGEPREHLRNMWQESAWNYPQQRDAVVFNIQGPNVQYGAPYAICYAHPALKIGQRYFKLEEVKC